MRDYGTVHSKFWHSEDMRALSDDGRLLALYLMTNGHGSIAGIFALPDGYVCWDMQWSSERVAKGFEELLRKGFATRCKRTSWVWITKFMEWNRLENPNQRKAAAKMLTQIPSECCWLADFRETFSSIVQQVGKGLRKGSATVSESTTTHTTTSGTTTTTTPTTTHTAGEPAEAGCVSGGGEISSLNGNGANGHDHAEADFALIQASYPQRAGDHKWPQALEHYTANLKAGITARQMAEGVKRYLAYCQAESITGTRYVRAAATFLGPEQGFLLPWTPSEKPNRETASERWLRNKQQEANDATG